MLTIAARLQASRHFGRSTAARQLSSLPEWATIDPDTMCGTTPAKGYNLINGEWTSSKKLHGIVDPLNGTFLFSVSCSLDLLLSLDNYNYSCSLLFNSSSTLSLLQPLFLLQLSLLQPLSSSSFELKIKSNFLQILYPSVCSKVFSMFDCVEIPGLPAGQSMQLRASLDVTCWTSKDNHLFYFGFAIFFLIIYVLAFPGVLFIVLYRNREALYDEEHPNHKRIAKSYSMFYNSYEPEFYWFECTVMLRKLMLVGGLSLSTFFCFL